MHSLGCSFLKWQSWCFCYLSVTGNVQSDVNVPTSCFDSNVFSPLTRTAAPMDFSQVSCPLMTPPISPAALVHRGSVINQGPTTGRVVTSSSSSSSSNNSSSSSSCLTSLSAISQPGPCASYTETLYHCLPQTSSGYMSPASGSVSNYQSSLRSASLWNFTKICISNLKWSDLI